LRNHTLKVVFIHARIGEHIAWANFVFELNNKKVIFIQSKRVGLDGRIHFKSLQL